jgi:hypothetical protein
LSDTALIYNLLARDGVTPVLKGMRGAWAAFSLAVAGAALYAGTKAVHMAADFESGMTRLVTGAGESRANLGVVSAGVLDMAGQVGVSTDAMARALYTIESGGQHGADGLNVLRAAAEGAKAENADLTTVADAVTSVLQDYHLKASDAALVTSQLVTAVGSGKTTMELFAGSLHSVLPIASSAGISLADVSGALASMTVHGMSADQAAENLNDTIKHLLAPTMVQTKELGQLGLSSSKLADMLGKRGVTGTLQDLSQLILSHMGPSGRVMLDTFNKSTDAARDANIMIAAMPASIQGLAHQYQTGAITLGDWRKALKATPADQANLLRQFASLQGQAGGFNDLLKSGSPAAQTYQDALRRVTGDATGLNTALMLTGENAAYTNGAVAAIAASTTEAGDHVKGWAEVQQTFNQRLSQAKGTVEALAIRIGNKLMPVAQELLDATMSIVNWFGKHKTIAETLGITIGVLAAGMLTYKTYMIAANIATNIAAVATKVWAAAQWLLNIAMDANPIGLVILAVTVLVGVLVYLWFHSAGFRKFFIGMWHDIWGFLKGVGHWFAHDFVDFFKSAGHWIQSHIVGAIRGINDKIQGFIRFVVDIPHKIANTFKSVLSGIAGWVSATFKSAMNGVIWVINTGVGFLDRNVIAKVNMIPGVSVPMIPEIPKLDMGGTVLRTGLAVVHRGEEYSGVGSARREERAVRVIFDLRGAEEEFKRMIRKAVRDDGQGNVQLAFGSGR